MPRCCVTVLDQQGEVVAYAEVYNDDAAAGTAQATIAATNLLGQVLPGQTVQITAETVHGKANSSKFPPK